MQKKVSFALATLIFLTSVIKITNTGYFLAVVLGSTLLTVAWNYYVVKKIGKVSPSRWLVVLPILYVLGFYGTLATISILAIKIFVAILGAGVFYNYEINFPKSPPVLDEEFFTLTAVIFLLVTFWGINFFYTPPWWVMSFLTLVAFWLIFEQIFQKIGVASHLLWSLVSTLILVEISAAVLYWPVNFFTSSVIVFSVFYLMYIFTELYYARRLSSQKIYFHVSIIAIVAIGSILSSGWSV